MNYKYIGIGSIISILILYLYFRFSNKDDNKSKTDELDTKLLFEKLQKNDKVLKLLLSHTIKYLKRDKYGNKQLLDRLNKDSLFNKDYETVRILVDTHNIIKKNTNSFNPGNYVFDLDSGTDNITGGLGRYKNVIGFRLIHAIMPNAAYIVDETNNIIVYEADSAVPGSQKEVVTLTLISGYYTLDNLINALPSSLGDNTTTSDNDNMIIRSTVTYNSTTHKFTFQCNNNSTSFYFNWNTNSITRKSAKLFGFYVDGPSTTSSATSHTSDFVPDMSIHYTDLVVDEIPYIACKNNPSGHHVIDRIPLNIDYGSNISYEPYRDPYQNYFLPISLNRLTIKLYEPIHGHIYNPQDSDHSLEFELTLIKNEKNIGLFN
jgi:hypothetical protein